MWALILLEASTRLILQEVQKPAKVRFEIIRRASGSTQPAAMSDNGDVNDFADVEDPAGDVGEDPFGGSDLEPVTDDEEEDDDGEDLLENQEMCVPIVVGTLNRISSGGLSSHLNL